MKITIQPEDTLTSAEREVVNQLWDAAFLPEENAGAGEFEWSSPEWHVLIWNEDNQLVAHVGMLTRTVKCDDNDAFVGGIGGVATHPEHQRKGYAGTAMRHAGLFLRDSLKVDFSLLVCRDALIPYYSKFGWQKFDGDLLVTQSTGQKIFTFNKTMLLAGTKPIPDCETIDLRGKPW